MEDNRLKVFITLNFSQERHLLIKETKTWITYLHLIRQSFQEYQVVNGALPYLPGESLIFTLSLSG